MLFIARLTTAAVIAFAVAHSALAQGYYQTQPLPFGGGTMTTGPNNYRAETRPLPFGGGVYTQDNAGNTYTTRPQPFGNGTWTTCQGPDCQ